MSELCLCAPRIFADIGFVMPAVRPNSQQWGMTPTPARMQTPLASTGMAARPPKVPQANRPRAADFMKVEEESSKPDIAAAATDGNVSLTDNLL